MNEIIFQLGISPTFDCFSNSNFYKFPNFAKTRDDVLHAFSSENEVCWVNPPFNLWPQVEPFLTQGKCSAIILCPAWRKPWITNLLKIASRRLYFEKGTHLFHTQWGTPWGVWALRVDKGPRPENVPEEALYRCKVHPSGKPPRSSLDPEMGFVGERTTKGKKSKVKPISELPPPSRKPKMLDLFSGTGSVSRVFESQGYEVTSLDHAPHFKPTITVDILKWDYKAQFPRGYFDIIFCCPPCEHFSRARTTAPRDLAHADLLVQKSLEIIHYFQPRKWFLENPRTGFLVQRPYMAKIPFVDVDYCQFSQWGYQKPTRIWGDPSISELSPRICDGKNCVNLVQRPNGRLGHREILGGKNMKITRNQKFRIPEALLKFLCNFPDPEPFEAAVNFIRALQLDALAEIEGSEPFSEIDAQNLAAELHKIGQLDCFVQSVVLADKPFEGPEVEKLRQTLMDEYRDTVFADKHLSDPPIRGPFGEATIDLKPGVTPVKLRPFRIQGERLESWKKLIDQLIADNKLEDGVSAWSSPSFPVPTKTLHKDRLVVDFRRLNDATITDAHPLPIIEDILNKQGKFCIWSVFDMKDGYHQIPLKKEDRHLTCMSTPRGTKQWKVLVMGLKNGGAIFQRMMEWVLAGIECADPYVDDVIIGSTGDTEEEAIQNHFKDVKSVLERFREQKLLVNPKKAHLFMREVEFCGHILSEGKRRPAPGKLLAIQKWELPQTVTQLRGFLGLTNYYSTYVDHYADSAGPLMSKLQLNRVDGKKGSQKRLSWRKCEIESFEKLKKLLAEKLELFRIDPDSPFILRADASDRAIGAVLEQQRKIDGILREVPVGFFSRKLSKSQLNWTPREKETYAVVSALRKWAGWIGLQPVLITTDHKSLEDWVHEKMDTPSGPGGRRARWHETLSKFDLEIKYIPGPDNVVADALSRFAYPASKAFQDSSFHGSEEARLEMKKIIEEELNESKMVGLIYQNSSPNEKNVLYIAGPMSRATLAKVTASQIYRVESQPSHVEVNQPKFVEISVQTDFPTPSQNELNSTTRGEFSSFSEDEFEIAPVRFNPKKKKKTVKFSEEATSSSEIPHKKYPTSRTTIHPPKPKSHGTLTMNLAIFGVKCGVKLTPTVRSGQVVCAKVREKWFLPG